MLKALKEQNRIIAGSKGTRAFNPEVYLEQVKNVVKSILKSVKDKDFKIIDNRLEFTYGKNEDEAYSSIKKLKQSLRVWGLNFRVKPNTNLVIISVDEHQVPLGAR